MIHHISKTHLAHMSANPSSGGIDFVFATFLKIIKIEHNNRMNFGNKSMFEEVGFGIFNFKCLIFFADVLMSERCESL